MKRKIMKNTISSIKDLVANNLLGEAIKALIELSNENTVFVNQALQLSSRFKKEKFNIINGLSDDKIEMNRISFSTLELCDEIKNYLNHKNDLTQPRHKEDSISFVDRKEKFYEKFIGLKIMNYEIIEYIHAGGFGGVYKARHNKLRNIVALKISHEIDEGFEFLDEIMSVGITGLQLLNHKYIIRTIDMGEIIINDSKRIFIIMEYISGGTLADLNKENLSGDEVLKRIEIFKKVCRGMHYSHNIRYRNKLGFQSTGLMHGDIKPANILLTETLEPRIMDFMFVDMSKLVEIKLKLPEEIERLNCATMAFGTEGYMPLEQKINGIVTEKTDIYGLGILLFEILCPIKFSDSKFINPTESSIKQIHEFLKRNCANLPKYVSKIIHKATKERDYERYYSVQEIIDEIEMGDPWYQKILR